MVVDFGLSKLYDPALSTVAGAKGWSSGFSPPEQYDGRTDARTDQYALAATLYALLTGKILPDVLERQLGYMPLRPVRELAPNVSERVETAIMRAMELDVVVLFGVGRLGKIGSELGRGIREFRAGLSGTTKTDCK